MCLTKSFLGYNTIGFLIFHFVLLGVSVVDVGGHIEMLVLSVSATLQPLVPVR